jgi:hypothetical protein
VGCEDGGREAVTLEVLDTVCGLVLGGRRSEEEVEVDKEVVGGTGVGESRTVDAVKTSGVPGKGSLCRTISTGFDMSRDLGPLMYRSEGRSVGGTLSWVR